MRLKTAIVTAAAASFLAAPIVANAAGAQRVSAPFGGENELSSSESLTQLILLALIAGVIIGGVELFGDDEPTSP